MIACLLRSLYKTSKATIILLLAVLLFGASKVQAGGNPVGRKRLFFIATASHYFNTHFLDSKAVNTPYPNNGRFTSSTLALTAEYGFSRRLSLVATLPYLYNTFSQTGKPTDISTGLGDAVIGGRWYFANIHYNVYFSGQASVVVPLYTNTADKNLGYGKLGSDLAFLTAGDFNIGEQKFYFEGSVGGRIFYGNQEPFQFKYSGNISYFISKRDQVSLADNGITSYSQDKTFNPMALLVNKSFFYNQATITYGHSFSRNRSAFLSFSQTLHGENTGIGSTVSVGYLYKY